MKELIPSKPLGVWPASLPLEIALEIDDLDTILERHGLTWRDWEVLTEAPAFRADLARMRKEIRDNGLSFREKARVQAECYLKELHKIVMNEDGDATASTRLDAIKSVVKWGNLEPKDDKGGSGATGNQFNIQINL